MTYTFRGFTIPEHMMDALQRWIQHGVMPGHFLTAVLTNDLSQAVGRADEENLHALPAYVGYLYNEAPSLCWGNYDKVQAWAKAHENTKAHEDTPP